MNHELKIKSIKRVLAGCIRQLAEDNKLRKSSIKRLERENEYFPDLNEILEQLQKITKNVRVFYLKKYNSTSLGLKADNILRDFNNEINNLLN